MYISRTPYHRQTFVLLTPTSSKLVKNIVSLHQVLIICLWITKLLGFLLLFFHPTSPSNDRITFQLLPSLTLTFGLALEDLFYTSTKRTHGFIYTLSTKKSNLPLTMTLNLDSNLLLTVALNFVRRKKKTNEITFYTIPC